MAKTKTLKTPLLKAVSKTDFTFNNPCVANIRFNSSNVLTIVVDLEQLTVLGTLIDEVNNKEYRLVGDLTVKE